MMAFNNNDPAAYLREQLSAADRQLVAKIEATKTEYMTSDRDEEIAQQLKRLTINAMLRRDPTLPYAANNRAPGKGLAIIAPSGAGKSRLMDEAFRDNPAFPNYGVAGAWCPLVSIAAPSPSTLGQIGTRILEVLGYDLERGLSESAAWFRVRQQLRINNILFLAIDDLNNALHVFSAEEIQKIRDTIKDLTSNPEWPVQVIVSGIPELMPLFVKDRQLKRRFRFMHLDKLSPKDHANFLKESVDHYVGQAKLKLDIKAEQHLVPRLLHAGQYEMGMTLEILAEAVETSLGRNGKDLTMLDFINAYASRNLMPDEQNPFFASAWHAINTSRLQPKDTDDDDDTVTPIGKKQSKK
jgi:hypothetical protein